MDSPRTSSDIEGEDPRLATWAFLQEEDLIFAEPYRFRGCKILQNEIRAAVLDIENPDLEGLGVRVEGVG